MTRNLLSRFDTDPNAAHELGKAGEHLVCFDLIMAGHKATLAAAGLPYDIIADINGKLIRVQVKSTCQSRVRNGKTSVYRWVTQSRIGRTKRTTKTRLDMTHCDIVALVALDIRAVAYLAVQATAMATQMATPGHEPRRTRNGGWTRSMDSFSLNDALNFAPPTKARFVSDTCVGGHLMTADNTYYHRGTARCRTCQRSMVNASRHASGVRGPLKVDRRKKENRPLKAEGLI